MGVDELAAVPALGIACPELSIVVPTFNESANVAELVAPHVKIM